MFWDPWIFPRKAFPPGDSQLSKLLCSSPSHKPLTTSVREGIIFPSKKKGFNCCFFAWGFPQLALKQSCSTGSTLNFGPQGFPLPAHRWCLPKPSASLMQRAPSVPSLLLTEASMCIWQRKKQPAFLLGSPYRIGSGLNLLQKLNLLVN